MGRAIAVAARLEPAAEPGTILVSENTYRLVGRSFEWQSMGGIAAKGYSEPVAAYRPLKHRAMPGKERGIEGLESPLVGRDEELIALRKAIDRLERGIGGIVTVVGEAGIGKSRLIAELKKREIMSRATFVEGRAISMGRNLSFHPIIEILKQWASIKEDDGEAASFGKLANRTAGAGGGRDGC